MSKKKRAVFAYFFFLFGCVFGIFCAIFTFPSYLCIMDAIIVGIATHLILLVSRCTHCGKYGVKINPFSKDNLFCQKCGKEQ